MTRKIEPLEAGLEASLRERLGRNPFIQFIGIQVPQLARGYARFVLPVRHELTNTIGLLQGGLLAALADEAVAYALYSLVPEGETFNTVEMKINFLAAVKDGMVEAVAQITKRGHTISLGEVEVLQGEKLVAKAICTYIHLPPR
jgi:acyl-CoA thioesterase